MSRTRTLQPGATLGPEPVQLVGDQWGRRLAPGTLFTGMYVRKRGCTGTHLSMVPCMLRLYGYAVQMQPSTHAYARVRARIYTHTFTDRYIYIYICMYIYMCVCVYIYIYI